MEKRKENTYYKAFRSEAEFQESVLNEYINIFQGDKAGSEVVYQLQDSKLEETVLGALMITNAFLWPEVSRFFVDGFWSNSKCEKIADAIRVIYDAKGKIDILTVTNEIRKIGLIETISPFYITCLTNNVNSDIHLKFHVQVLYEKYMKRQLLLMSAQIQSQISEPDIAILMDMVQERIDKLRDMCNTNPIQFVHEQMPAIIQEIAKKQVGEEHDYTDVSTTFADLDAITSGFTNSDMVVIGARPSQGKTAFGLSVLNNLVKSGHAVGFFSAEMSSKSIILRLMSMCSGINSRDMKGHGKMKVSMNLLKMVHESYPTNFMIDDTSNISIQELKMKAKKMKRLGVKIIVVDYLQLLTSERQHFSREQEVSFISRSLKGLAKELNIPIVVLAQLNREAEKRADGKPQSSDLRDSGGIEQDADQLMFLYDPAKYGIDEYDVYLDGIKRALNTDGLKIIITAKNRNGALGETAVKFTPETTLFSGLNGSNEDPFSVSTEPPVF